MKAYIDDTPRKDGNEMPELYSTGVEIRRSLLEIPEADADKEFERTINSLKSQKKHILTLNWKRPVAAAAVILVIGSVAATGLIGSKWSWHSNPEETATAPATESVVTYLPDQGERSDTLVKFPECVVYDRKPLEEILKEISKTLCIPVECMSEKTGIRIYLSLPAGSNVNDLVKLLNAFDNIEAEMVTDGDNNQKLVVR